MGWKLTKTVPAAAVTFGAYPATKKFLDKIDPPDPVKVKTAEKSDKKDLINWAATGGLLSGVVGAATTPKRLNKYDIENVVKNYDVKNVIDQHSVEKSIERNSLKKARPSRALRVLKRGLGYGALGAAGGAGVYLGNKLLTNTPGQEKKAQQSYYVARKKTSPKERFVSGVQTAGIPSAALTGILSGVSGSGLKRSLQAAGGAGLAGLGLGYFLAPKERNVLINKDLYDQKFKNK